MDEKIFTLEEVESLIPVLEERFKEIRIKKSYLTKISGEIRKAADQTALDGGSPYGPSYIKTLDSLNQEIEEIHKEGVVIKDLDKGLCDFSYISNGRTVYLCWKSGETSLQWWHEVEDGFTGRKRLEEL
ncbi:MAG: DUF2203 domain-containing protein [Nitrospirae bacterium]|nr:DUF2203 domain-containing protein [Nitrospirota bacterium]MBI3351006.1 DUF2203 domain-containing protein [Nitrospirota bacterium]